MRRLATIFLCTLLFCCNNSKQDLPFLSYIISEGQKTHYSINYNGFVNQFGDVFSHDNLEGRVVIANFFFTKCPSICPPMRLHLINLANAFENTDLLIVSHTIDPKNDTLDVLKAYAENTGISDRTWQFVRAKEADTKLQARQYMTNFKPYEDGTDFYHSSYIALLDKEQYIRGFYNILVTEERERLENDIRNLLD